jgi:hypothetical protein
LTGSTGKFEHEQGFQLVKEQSQGNVVIKRLLYQCTLYEVVSTQMAVINTYGLRANVGDQGFYDRAAFALKLPVDRGVPPREELFKRIADDVLPKHFEWHEWTNRAVRGLCGEQWVGLAGCGGSSKTFNVASFACVWWLCQPEQSSVIFCSTTAKALRRRGWAEVQRCFSRVNGDRDCGNFVDSRMLWQADHGDDKNAIIGIAVREGSVTKVADNIKGHHTRRQMVVIDEATAVPNAIFEACFNLSGAAEEFIMVVIGNPRSRLDEMGKFCEPKEGWNSVSVETEEWETRPQMNGKCGIVIRFDAEKSPNIVEGKIVSRHLPTKARVESRRAQAGGENSPSYWSNERGFWPPTGLTKTVFSEVGLVQCGGYDKHLFTGRNFRIIGSFDPAFGGGDRPVLRFAKMGELADGKMGIESMAPIIIPLNANSKDDIHFQLLDQVRRQCESFIHNGVQYSCAVEDLGVDGTGEGGGLCDIMARMWGPIIRIEFGGAASEDSCSPEDIRPAKEVYHNKRAEMYFRTRDAYNHKQMRGMDRETAKELCTLEFDDSKARIVMQKKADYKELYGESPDFADSEVMITEVARLRGFRLAPIGQTIQRSEAFDKMVATSHAVFEDSEEHGFQSEELEEVEA